MQWLHNLFDQAKYCILDLTVLILFCMGMVRIVLYEANRIFSHDRKKRRRAVD